jgi:hypothetical protein
MSLVDRAALDFLVNYDLAVVWNRHTRELADTPSSQQISVGIVNRRPPIAKIAVNSRWVITDPRSSAGRGKLVFRAAQTRIEVITRTETLRAYGQGAAEVLRCGGRQACGLVTAGDEPHLP